MTRHKLIVAVVLAAGLAVGSPVARHRRRPTATRSRSTTSLGSESVTTATSGIEQQSLDVCKTQIGL
jgi:hypothetical protein